MQDQREQYHLRELQTALDPSLPQHSMPPPGEPGATVLDIGCGAGQTLIAGFQEQNSFGIDVDFDALKLGSTLSDKIRFVQGSAELLPYKSQQFEMVIARVSLPYTRLSESLAEIHRVLKNDGQLWTEMHPFSIPWHQVRQGSNYKGKLYFAYIVVNSILFHLFQKQFSVRGKCETFQTHHSIRKALERCGFQHIAIDQRKGHFQVTARKA